MAAKSNATDTERIESLLLGQLPPAESERLSAQFADDSRLSEVAERLPDDTLLSALKHAPTAVDPETERLAVRLVERLQRAADDSVTATATPSTDGPILVDGGDPMPEKLEYFKLERELGRGGMGTVYLADDTRLGRKVAIKTLKREVAHRPGAKERFLREARTAAALEHECLVPIYYVGEDAGIPFLAMPLLRGHALDDHLAKHGGTLPVAEAVRVAAEVTRGLAAAHAAGLIHRDIKPSNVWIEGDGGRVRVLDFGLARSVADETNLTASGMIVGTPAYMAPEQARSRAVDGRADLWSVGVVLYQMLTGRRPFTGNDPVALLSSLALDTPVPPRELNPKVPATLSALVMKLLEKDPANRPPNAAAVLAALVPPPPVTGFHQDERTETIEAPAEPAREPAAVAPGPAPTRRAVPVAARVALALLLFAGVGTAVYQIVFTTKDGTLVVEVDQSANVRFKNGKLEIYDEAGKRLYTLEPSETNKALPAGKYRVAVVGTDGLKVDTETFVMERKGKVIVKVTAGPPKEVAVVDPKKPDPVKPVGPGKSDGTALHLFFGGLGAEAPAPALDTQKPWTAEAYFTPLTENVAKNTCRVVGADQGFGLGVREGKYSGYSTHGETVSGTVKAGERVHLACVQTETKRMLFLNGKLMESTDNPLAEVKSVVDKLQFGLVNNLPNTPPIDVLVEGVRLSQAVRYTKDFTPPGRHTPDKETLALYHCDEGRGDELTDSSGHNRHGKIINAKWGKAPAVAPGPATADRKAVEVALKNTFWAGIEVDGVERPYKGADDLPQSFQVVSFNCNRNKSATDESLECLRGLRHLKWVQITNCAATDKTLTYLTESKDLERLVLYNSKITDAGLETLAGFKKIKSIDLTQLPLTEAAVKKLAAALPGCKIVWAGGELGAAPLDTAWEKAVAAMPADDRAEAVRKELQRLNPKFDKPMVWKVEKDAVTELEFEANEVSDIAPLRALPGLRRLVVSYLKATDLAPLKGMKLTYLELYYCEKLFELAPLAGMPLETLNVWNGFLGTDLAPLKGMPLKVLNCGGSGKKLDLTPLAGAPLEELFVNFAEVTDLAPLAKAPLRVLHCARGPLSDLKPLTGKKLEHLNISGTEVSDLTPLKGMPLVSLNCGEAKVTDLSPLTGMALKAIVCDFKLARDGKVLRSMKSLETINEKPPNDFLGKK